MKKFYAFLALAAVATGAMADDFVSDGTGNVYTFNALSQIEGSGVTLQDDGSYLVAANFTIAEGDVLQLDKLSSRWPTVCRSPLTVMPTSLLPTPPS